MEWYFLCHVGAEEALQNELKRLGVESTRQDGWCIVECEEEKAGELLYYSQCATRVLRALSAGPLDKIDLSSAHEIIPKESTFKVECSIEHGAHDLLSGVDVAAELGEQVEREVSLSKPDYVIFCQVTSIAICGIDVSGDMSKRYHRIFTNARSIKGTLAASLLNYFPLSGDVLDPFANTGEIAIEAALQAGHISPLQFSRRHITKIALPENSPQEPKNAVWCFDPQLGNVRSAKKNAKLAGVDKILQYSKLDPEWIDVKFEKGVISAIVTCPPPVTARSSETAHLKELCYQAAFALKKGGKLIVCSRTPETTEALEKYAAEYKLKNIATKTIYSGKLAHTVICYDM